MELEMNVVQQVIDEEGIRAKESVYVLVIKGDYLF